MGGGVLLFREKREVTKLLLRFAVLLFFRGAWLWLDVGFSTSFMDESFSSVLVEVEF